MMPNVSWCAVVAASVCVASTVGAQGIQRRVDASPAGIVQFHYASRASVCGDGRTYMRVDNDGWIGSNWDGMRAAACERGPVRVVVVRSGKEVVRIETYAGPLASDSAASDLGAVPAGEAATYLLSVATSVDGRVGRDALTGASLADSADVTRQLLAIARDQARSRELRRSALTWLVRQADEHRSVAMSEVVRAVSAIARDESESNGSRQQALNLLARAGRGDGIPELITLASQPNDLWLARQSVEALARSGDPRARRTLRDIVSNASAPADARVAAFTGLANEYGTPADVELIRAAYPSLTSERSRDAALGAVASVGSAASRAWLASVVRDKEQPMRQRRRAAELMERAGASSADLSKLYDEVDETDIRTAIVEQLAQSGTREATTKLLAIAKAEPNLAVRRRAVGVLSRSEDPRVREVLQGVVERP